MGRPVSVVQKFILAIAAVAIAVRLFYPATYPTRFGQQTDVGTTVLQLLGMLVVFVAAYYLASTGNVGSLRSLLRPLLIMLAWMAFFTTAALGISRFGIARSVETVNWLWAGIGLAGFIALLWLSWFIQRRSSAAGQTQRVTFAAAALVLILPLAGFGAHLYQGRLLAARYAKQIDFAKELDDLRNRIVEGEQIGPVKLGMSLQQVVDALGARFYRGDRLSNGLTQYLWRGGANQDWYVVFNASNERAVIIAYGFRLLPVPKGYQILSNRQLVENVRFKTQNGARFGDSPGTIEALYGKPSLTTPLKESGYARNLRFHYSSIRTEFQFSDSYGLLSVLVHAPGFAPDRVLRGR